MQLPSRFGFAFALLAATLVPSAALADAPRRAPARVASGSKDAVRAKKKGAAESIGAPNAGKLRGAVKLRTSGDVAVRTGSNTWGLPDLVRLIQHAASEVARKHGGGPLLVGDLSARDGGALFGHNSHQSGRDADIAFYATNSKGKPFRAKRFIAFDDSGRGRDVDWLQFDDARNWAFVKALLEDKRATLRYVFVTNALRARMLAYGKKKNASPDLLARAAAAMMSPADADVHDDHFHIRIACPESMRGACAEESVLHGHVPVARAGAPERDAGAMSARAAKASAAEEGSPNAAAEPGEGEKAKESAREAGAPAEPREGEGAQGKAREVVSAPAGQSASAGKPSGGGQTAGTAVSGVAQP